MSGIIEIWRSDLGLGLPTRFTVGTITSPEGSSGPEDPIVKHIDYRESGAMAGKRFNQPVFCVTFHDSSVQRFVPADQVVDIAYETRKAEDAPSVPALET